MDAVNGGTNLLNNADLWELAIFKVNDNDPFWTFPSSAGNRVFLIGLENASPLEYLPVNLPISSARLTSACLYHYLAAPSANNLLSVKFTTPTGISATNYIDIEFPTVRSYGATSTTYFLNNFGAGYGVPNAG